MLAYTDGVIERRGEVIDEGIGRLETVFGAVDRDLAAAELAESVIRDVAEVTAADDDIAVLVMRFLHTEAGVELPPDVIVRAR